LTLPFKTPESALWAFHRGQDYADAVVKAVNLGDDADSVGAICGQLAGASYGVAGIPDRWLRIIAMRAEIVSLADRVAKLAGIPPLSSS
jgi:ADP-ribosyl-[dinitrogen reductase] hydrolase